MSESRTFKFAVPFEYSFELTSEDPETIAELENASPEQIALELVQCDYKEVAFDLAEQLITVCQES